MLRQTSSSIAIFPSSGEKAIAWTLYRPSLSITDHGYLTKQLKNKPLQQNLLLRFSPYLPGLEVPLQTAAVSLRRILLSSLET